MLVRLLAAVLLVVLAAAGLAQAPEAEATRLSEQWEAQAQGAEQRLADPTVRAAALEALRREIAEQRGAAQALRGTANAAVEPLRVQLEALGPPPAEGAIEAPEIADQRARLSEELARAEAPARIADSAYQRADAIIGRIDEMLRRRFADELLAQRGTPLHPASWIAAVAEIVDRGTLALRDATDGIGRSGSRPGLALITAALGLIVLVGVRTRVMDWFGRRLSPALIQAGPARQAGPRMVWFGAGLTFAALLVPMAGAAMLLIARDASGMINGYAAPFLRDLNAFAFCLVVAYWLSQTLFGVEVPARTLVPMAPPRARQAGRMTLVLGVVIGLDSVLVDSTGAAFLSLPTLAVMNLILIAVGATALWRLGRALRPDPVETAREEADADEAAEGTTPGALGDIVRGVIARGCTLFAIAAPLLAAFGYYAAARFAFYPVLLTLAVIGGVVVFVALVQDGVEAALTDADGKTVERSSLRLLPILSGFGLVCLAVPLLALVWGARESDLSETWRVLTEGLAVGETRIRPIDFVTFAVVFAVGYTLTRLVQGILRGTVLPQTALDSGGRMAIVSMAGYVGFFFAGLAAISATGIDLSSLAIVAGALSVGIGFGLQTIVSNFVSGLILLIERPIKEGDWIKVGEFEGTVRRISVRSTVVQTFDRAAVVVPNADLITRPVLNRTLTGTVGRIIIPVGVAYGSDTRRVEAVLKTIAERSPILLRRPAPIVLFREFGRDALIFEIRGFLRDVNTSLTAASEFNHEIARRFAEERIEIPYSMSDLSDRPVVAPPDSVAPAMDAPKRA